MKKLLKISTIALILFSFMATSCDKEKLAAILRPVSFNSTYTTQGNNKPIVVKKDTVEVTVGTFIRIEPVLGDEWKKCRGTWAHSVEGAWTSDDYSAGRDTNTGVMNFSPKKPGTFRIKFTYTCPDGSFTSKTITIIVT